MSDPSVLDLPEAARRLGVPIRVLRRAIRAKRLPAPPSLAAAAPLPAEWFESALAAVEASPKALQRTSGRKVPPFARYEGTSAWHKYRRRVRAYAWHRAQQAAEPSSGNATPSIT